jgi:hypothetical protein
MSTKSTTGTVDSIVHPISLRSVLILSRWVADCMMRVRVPAGAGNFSLHHRIQTGSGAHPDSYPMGTRGSFPGGKAAGA